MTVVGEVREPRRRARSRSGSAASARTARSRPRAARRRCGGRRRARPGPGPWRPSESSSCWRSGPLRVSRYDVTVATPTGGPSTPPRSMPSRSDLSRSRRCATPSMPGRTTKSTASARCRTGRDAEPGTTRPQSASTSASWPAKTVGSWPQAGPRPATCPADSTPASTWTPPDTSWRWSARVASWAPRRTAAPSESTPRLVSSGSPSGVRQRQVRSPPAGSTSASTGSVGHTVASASAATVVPGDPLADARAYSAISPPGWRRSSCRGRSAPAPRGSRSRRR